MRMVLDAQLNDFRALYAKHPSNRGLMRGGEVYQTGPDLVGKFLEWRGDRSNSARVKLLLIFSSLFCSGMNQG